VFVPVAAEVFTGQEVAGSLRVAPSLVLLVGRGECQSEGPGAAMAVIWVVRMRFDIFAIAANSARV